MKHQNGEANKRQDGANKRNINADAKLLAVFGKPQVTMFELAGSSSATACVPCGPR